MSRVSPKTPNGRGASEKPPARQRSAYLASEHYGTRRSELDKQVIPFGNIRVTIYRRSDIESSSWFFRMYLREEGRHYRKSLQTSDRKEALARAQAEAINVLAKVHSGQRMLALSLKDLVRRFAVYQESLVQSGQLSPRTLDSQNSRVNLGCEFLKSIYSAGIETKISTIDGATFNDYLNWRLQNVAKKRDQGTIRRDVVRDELLVIRKMFRFAKKERWCTERSIPTWDFIVETEGPKRRRITSTNYKDFINVTLAWAKESKGGRDYYNRQVLMHIIDLVSRSGLRSGEVFGLLNRDVELRGKDACLVTIRAATSKVRKGRQVEVADSMLTNWLKKRQRNRDPKDYVFSSYSDGRMNFRNSFYHSYKSLRERLKEIELDWFDLYHCRHWWITNNLYIGQPIHLVARVAGTSAAEIERTYDNVLTELASKEFNKQKLSWNADGSYKTVSRLKEASDG